MAVKRSSNIHFYYVEGVNKYNILINRHEQADVFFSEFSWSSDTDKTTTTVFPFLSEMRDQ